MNRDVALKKILLNYNLILDLIENFKHYFQRQWDPIILRGDKNLCCIMKQF